MAEPPQFEPAALARSLLDVAEPQALARGLDALAKSARTVQQRRLIADIFLAAGPAKHALALEWLARWRGTFPLAMLSAVLAVLGDRKQLAELRVAAAAGVLRGLPDRLSVVKPLARSVTTGLSPLRTLERLRHVQHQLSRGESLDALIERKELRVKIDCPRCGIRLPRREMVKHLWNEHRVLFENGKILPFSATVQLLKLQYSEQGDPSAIDRAWLAGNMVDPGGEPLAAYRAWLVGEDPTASELAPILARAREQSTGVCPSCFAEIRASFAPSAAPLAVGHGRVAGDGYAVEVSDSEWFRRVRIVTPEGVLGDRPDPRLSPSGAATLAALPFALLTFLAAWFVPRSIASPFWITLIPAAITAVVFGAVLSKRRPLPKASASAFDFAWTALAWRLLGNDYAVPFLTRLCRASLGRGDPVERVSVLNRLREWVAESPAPTAERLSLQAASAVLAIDDAGRLGRDRVVGLADLVTKSFRGEQPLSFAAYTLEGAWNRPHSPDEGERSRLRVLLLAGAFEAGLKPRDLLDVWRVIPALKEAMVHQPSHRLGLLFAAWVHRNRLLAAVGDRLESVFGFCRLAPFLSERLLVEHPDLLFVYRPANELGAALGPILLCGRGVAIDGKFTAKPDAVVARNAMTRGGEKSYELTVGTHSYPLKVKPDEAFLNALREMLRYRHEVILPASDHYLEPQAPAVLEKLLRPLGQRCANCGRTSAAAPGHMGVEVSPSEATRGQLGNITA